MVDHILFSELKIPGCETLPFKTGTVLGKSGEAAPLAGACFIPLGSNIPSLLESQNYNFSHVVFKLHCQLDSI